MLRGTTPSASAIVGTAVFRIVVSSDSIRNATATSQGRRRLTEGSGGGGTEGLCRDLSAGCFEAPLADGRLGYTPLVRSPFYWRSGPRTERSPSTPTFP